MQDVAELHNDDQILKELAESQRNKYDYHISAVLIVGSLFFLDICTALFLAIWSRYEIGLMAFAASAAPIAYVILCVTLITFLSYRRAISPGVTILLSIGLVFSLPFVSVIMMLVGYTLVLIMLAVIVIPPTLIGFTTVLLFSTKDREACFRSNIGHFFLFLCSILGVMAIGGMTSRAYFQYLDSEALLDHRYYLTIRTGFLDPDLYLLYQCDVSGMNCKSVYDNIPIEYRHDNMELDLRVNADEIEIRYADGEIICTYAPTRPTENESCLKEAPLKND